MLFNVIRFKITTHIQKLSRRDVTESALILHTLLGQYRTLEVLDSTLGPKMSYPVAFNSNQNQILSQYFKEAHIRSLS